MKRKTKKTIRRPKEAPKKCYFCNPPDGGKKEPDYAEGEVLRRFITERGRILPRLRSGVCAKHHRKLSGSIKHARFLSLLPFTARV